MIGSIITEVKGDMDFEKELGHTGSMLILPLRDDVLFPHLPRPVEIGRETSIATIKKAVDTNSPVFVTAQKSREEDDASVAELHSVGVVCKVIKFLELPDGTKTAFLLAGPKARLTRIIRRRPLLRGNVEIINSVPDVKGNSEKQQTLLTAVREIYDQMVQAFSEDSGEIRSSLSKLESPELVLNFITGNTPLEFEVKQRLLEIDDFEQRALETAKELSRLFEMMKIKAEITRLTHEELTRQQKEHFLQQQIRTIQNELGGTVEDAEEKELQERAQKKKWPEYAAKHFDKELKKLERFNVQNPEYSIQYNYLDTLLNLPWDNYSPDNFSLDEVEKILDRDHYGLEKVKERILEQVAVLKLRKDMKAPILCLYGPPGVGKTSLGKSVAEALGREYCRISLGGLHDEAEIRGHRRTYIGALPGRIMSAMSKCGTSNPVFVLDEIDKIGKDFKGDPSTALLEVLDPEQNVKFHDNYIDVDYNLSKILFIATANDLSTISRPLLDRMELINISGYVTDEKREIALRHLVKKQLSEHGFEENEIEFTLGGINYIIDRHTRESGVRQLDKGIARVLRKIARLKASDKEYPRTIDADKVLELLGPDEVLPEEYENNDLPGVVTGLAWTQAGGEILFIESSLSKGKGEKLTLTGNLGDVMKESAMIALKYIKANAEMLGIPMKAIEENDVHIHVPEGAIPKDGPSAGITMAVSLASSFTGKKVRDRLAMTGEITLRGKITPVGGIKEKILAAKRAGITDVILCSRNRKDVEEIKPDYLEGLHFHYFDHIGDALAYALID